MGVSYKQLWKAQDVHMLYAHECICEFKLCAYNGWISSGFSA